MAQALKQPVQQNFVQKTLGATLNAGANVATLNNTTSIQNLPGVFIIDRIDTNGVETPTKREVCSFTGTSGVTTTGLVKNADGSGTDQTHAVGAIVEFGPDVIWAQSVIDGLSQVVVASTGLVDTTKIVDLTTVQALTNKTLTDATNVLPVNLTNTVTLTNKRITPRILSAASYTTDTGTSLNCDNLDRFIVTAQAGALKFNNPTGTPTDGQTLWIMVTGTGARALTWDTQFEASAAVALPTTTVTTARLDIGFVWRADTSKWRCVASA